MTPKLLDNLRHKIMGDHRSQPAALREAGFADEAAAAAWARDLLGPDGGASDLRDLRAIRSARPDLTMRTARYVLQQERARRA